MIRKVLQKIHKVISLSVLRSAGLLLKMTPEYYTEFGRRDLAQAVLHALDLEDVLHK